MSTAAGTVRMNVQPTALELHWPDGAVSTFTSLWLRDNCPQDRDARNGQRLIDVADLPEEPRIRSAVLRGEGLHVAWEGEAREVRFDLGWLAAHAPGRAAGHAPAPRLWLEGARLDAAREFGWSTLARLHADNRVRAEWLARLLADGIAFITEVPCVPEALTAAVAPLGSVCATNYGEVFDVRSVPQPENLAYSDLGLGLHTDNPYREPVPGFQALHALVTSPEGGDTLLADGFAIACELEARSPADFAVLTRTPVPFHYRSRDAELHAERPLIQLSCSGEIQAVHYNSRSIAPLALPAEELALFYRAYRHFAQLLREARYQVRLRLRDGELMLFDNQRVLHGRTAFSSGRHARHLRGCYLTRDSVYSAAALLRRPAGAVA